MDSSLQLHTRIKPCHFQHKFTCPVGPPHFCLPRMLTPTAGTAAAAGGNPRPGNTCVSGKSLHISHQDVSSSSPVQAERWFSALHTDSTARTEKRFAITSFPSRGMGQGRACWMCAVQAATPSCALYRPSRAAVVDLNTD